MHADMPTFNRTSMESKLISQNVPPSHPPSFNRTSMESKHKRRADPPVPALLSFNRTSMESKLGALTLILFHTLFF